MAKILIIDDDKMLCKMMSQMIAEKGNDVSFVNTLTDGLRKISSETYDIVLLDVQLPDGNGLRAVPQIRETLSAPEVIIITGFSDPDGAELAINSGAWDYIEKPATMNQIMLPLSRAIEYRKEKYTKKPILLKRNNIIGSGPKLQEALEKLAQTAVTDSSVLITGETGVGKELFASAIHTNSQRAANSYVVVDCASLSDSLIESTLFGHEKGAYSGADRSRIGLIKEADGGTLFLDEIGELPLSIQASFLRVLQEHTFRPVGSEKEIRSDFRLVSATNRDLDDMVRTGEFRRDLLYRLRSVTIEIPPLRERKSDIFEIAMHLVNTICNRDSIEIKGFSPDFIHAIRTYSWPGNVRELVSTIEQVFATAGEQPVLTSYLLPTSIRAQVVKTSFSDKKPDSTNELDISSFLYMEHFPLFKIFKENNEYEYLKKLMALSSGKKTVASKKSGLSRPRLYELLKKHNL